MIAPIPRVLYIPFFVVVADQTVKYLAKILGVETVCNDRLAFGLSTGVAIVNNLLALAIVAVIFYCLLKVKDKYQKIALSVIFGGGVSNLIDRFWVDGCVVDMIHVPFWPSFNVADIFISAGVLFLFLTFFKLKKL